MPASHTVTCGRLQLLDDRREVLLGDGGIEAAQRVVGAELDQHDVGLVGQHPVEPVEPARRGVAGHALIQDRDVAALRLQRRLEPRREGLLGLDAVARREAVAEHGDLDRRALCIGRQPLRRTSSRTSSSELTSAAKRPYAMARSHGLLSRLAASRSLLPVQPIVRFADVHLDMASDAGMVNILRGITLDIASGEITAVVGPVGRRQVQPDDGGGRPGARDRRAGSRWPATISARSTTMPGRACAATISASSSRAFISSRP